MATVQSRGDSCGSNLCSHPCRVRLCSCSHSHCVLVRAPATLTVTVVTTHHCQCVLFSFLKGGSRAGPGLHEPHLNRRLPTSSPAGELLEAATLKQPGGKPQPPQVTSKMGEPRSSPILAPILARCPAQDAVPSQLTAYVSSLHAEARITHTHPLRSPLTCLTPPAFAPRRYALTHSSSESVWHATTDSRPYAELTHSYQLRHSLTRALHRGTELLSSPPWQLRNTLTSLHRLRPQRRDAELSHETRSCSSAETTTYLFM